MLRSLWFPETPMTGPACWCADPLQVPSGALVVDGGLVRQVSESWRKVGFSDRWWMVGWLDGWIVLVCSFVYITFGSVFSGGTLWRWNSTVFLLDLIARSKRHQRKRFPWPLTWCPPNMEQNVVLRSSWDNPDFCGMLTGSCPSTECLGENIGREDVVIKQFFNSQEDRSDLRCIWTFHAVPFQTFLGQNVKGVRRISTDVYEGCLSRQSSQPNCFCWGISQPNLTPQRVM